MIIPHRNETEFVIFRCTNCNYYFFNFGRGQVQISCTVMHSPGDCCHYSDTPISAEKVKRLLKEMKSDG